jgi:DNA-binding NarL/FixJ family response regulator
MESGDILCPVSVRAKQSNGGAKPRVLLVDDHHHVLDAVAASLAEEFDVAAVATDGVQALEAAFRVNPDVIVLDVSMPGMDGFQTFRALQNAGSQTPVVFLSMYDADVYVSEAFRCGGKGFVLKSHIERDLGSALDQALLGRLFVPSLTSLYRLAEGGGHAMQVHDNEESFLDGLSTVFDLALRLGDATCVISTEQVRDGLARRLRARGWNVGGTAGHKRYLAVDSTDAVNRLMRNGVPDARILAEIAAELEQYRQAVAERSTSRLTVFGNMVMLLIEDGNVKGAIALENLWNTVTEGLPFLTLCGYASSCFHGDAPDLASGARAQHFALGHS